MLHRLALLTSFSLAAFAADAAALPVALAPADAALAWSGRWDTTQPAGPRCEWPAGSVRFVTDASAVNVVLGGPKGHAFQVIVDGKPTSVVTIAEGQSVYEAAAGLPAGTHTIELVKRTECWGGPVQVQGFQLSAGAKASAAPALKRRVEFLGDSITCGYGNEAASEKEHFNFATENAWLAWGAITARQLEAEYHCEAISGIWLQDNGKKDPLPKLWDRTMPFTKSQPWDFAKWQADVVVVNLGTNDSGAKVIDEAKWTTAYKDFIAKIRAAYPNAHIFLTIGSMGHGPQGVIPTYNDAIVVALAAAGDAKVHAVAIKNQDKGKNGIGADWHPSVKTHQVMADQISAAIRKELGW